MRQQQQTKKHKVLWKNLKFRNEKFTGCDVYHTKFFEILTRVVELGAENRKTSGKWHGKLELIERKLSPLLLEIFNFNSSCFK